MNGRRTATVTCELAVQLVVPGEGSVPLPVTLSYDASDPYAVHAIFRTGQSEGVEWVFARELLAEGAVGPTGQGDVRVQPASEGDDDIVHISLASPDGEALLAAPAVQLIDFVQRTYELVPIGYESMQLDVDGAISSLLA
jgi:hypothetical protein